MRIDSFYTSSILADKLVAYINLESVIKVMYPCVGDGELLRSVLRLKSTIKAYGSDISDKSIDDLRSLQNDWELAIIDLLSFDLNSLDRFYNQDLILLNPPFTCKGATIHKFSFDGIEFSSSTAMFFLIKAFEFLRESGEMFCIMPISVCYSKKDKNIWNYLEKYHNAKILEIPNERNHFKGCFPNIVLISLQKGKLGDCNESLQDHIKIRIKNLKRGNLSVCNIEKHESSNGISFIHTTNLVDNNLKIFNTKLYYKETSIIEGPAILIPRIVKPSLKKIVKINKGQKYLMSDCLIALEVYADILDSNYEFIYNNWNYIQSTYIGTGAKYTTLERLSTFFIY